MNEIVNPYHLRVELPGKAPYTLDLTEFFLGGSAATVEKRTAWKGDYRARRGLATEFAGLLTVDPQPKSTVDAWKTGLRHFFRFLDHREDEFGESVDASAAVTDAHGPAFRAWIGSETVYKLVKSLLNKMRALSGCPSPLFWAARQPDASRQREPIDEKAVRRLSHALRHEARRIQTNLKEGERLAGLGRDPRGFGPDAILVPENRAWLFREMLRTDLPDRKAVVAQRASGLLSGPGAANLSPGLSEKYAGGLGAVVRWFVPSFTDITVFFHLFLIGTGWNLSTACAVDASVDDWWQPHPQTDRVVVVHAWKNRADKHQFAVSMRKPEWHPFRILEYVLEITKPLRTVLRRRLADLREEYASSPSDELAVRIEQVEALVRTPWLFASYEPLGSISGITADTDSTWLNKFARSTVARHGLEVEHPRLADYRVSDARDAWIGFAYVNSGFNVFMARLASQHASLRTLKHYLHGIRYRRHSEKEVRKLQHALFSEIEAGRPLDPARLRLLVRNGKITPEQESRLADRRARTRLGMGCLDPRTPPKLVAPEHVPGSLCRVQRCIGCSHGVVFADSMPALARALAELRHVRRQMPAASWAGSSFEAEHDGLERTLEGFEAAAVAAELDSWTVKLLDGEVRAHVVYPSY